MKNAWRRPVLLTTVLLAIFGPATTDSAAPPSQSRGILQIDPPSHQQVPDCCGNFLALAPDGRYMAYVAEEGRRRQLYGRPLGEAAGETVAMPIPGTQDADSPFFSPDGKWVGFYADGRLMKVPVAGGAPVTLCECRSAGAAWAPDGSIIFSDSSSLWRVPATGGDPELVAEPEPARGETRYVRPEILPGGTAALIELWRGPSPQQAGIATLSLESGEVNVVVEQGTSPRYVPPGYLVYAWEGALIARPFDLQRLAVTGQPTIVVQGVKGVEQNGAAHFSFSAEGTLVYAPGGEQLGWIDRQGRWAPMSEKRRPSFRIPYLSPDDRRIAVLSTNSFRSYDIWIYEIGPDFLTRLTREGRRLGNPVWSRDGRWVFFASRLSEQTGAYDVYRTRTDFSGEAELLLARERSQFPQFMLPDGSLAYTELQPGGEWNIWALPLNEGRTPRFLRASPGLRDLAFSPDGTLIAHTLRESGQRDVYVSELWTGRSWRVSDGDSRTSVFWSRDGRELFYRAGRAGVRFMSVTISTAPTFEAGTPRELFEVERTINLYGATADGRFLATRTEGSDRAIEINVIPDWVAELERLVAGRR